MGIGRIVGGAVDKTCGFLGDFFLPKHLFRFAGKVGKGISPAFDMEGETPSTKQVIAHFMGQAARASQTIGDRAFSGKGWASQKVPLIGMNLGGLAIMGAWACVVMSLMFFGYSRLVAGIRKTRPTIRPGITAGQNPGTPEAKAEGK